MVAATMPTAKGSLYNLGSRDHPNPDICTPTLRPHHAVLNRATQGWLQRDQPAEAGGAALLPAYEVFYRHGHDTVRGPLPGWVKPVARVLQLRDEVWVVPCIGHLTDRPGELVEDLGH